MEFILDRISAWLTFDPVMGILMFGTAFVLFVLKLRESKKEDDKFWQWMKRILEALGTALLFMLLLWVFRGVLNGNYSDFIATHGRVSEANYSSVQTIWGGPLVQRELTVTHSREETVLEEIPREDPSLPPLYKRSVQRVEVPQNSILASTANARLVQNPRQKGSAFYAGFEISFDIKFEIVNDSRFKTRADFYFPLSPRQAIFDKLTILENGVSLSSKLKVNEAAQEFAQPRTTTVENSNTDIMVSEEGIAWSKEMMPREKISLSISYFTRGLDYFYYQIQSPREINNFVFQLACEDLPLAMINYPDGCFPPTSEAAPINDDKGSLLEWKFNNAITTAGMGISLPRPEQPGVKESLVLANSPYALMFLIITICLTFLILGRKLNFLQITTLAALYCLLYYVISSLSDFALGFWGTLVPGALLTLGLIFLLLIREQSVLIRVLVLSVSGFFTLVYPLFNLATEYENSINGIVVILIILYLFFIAFYAQVKKKEQPQ